MWESRRDFQRVWEGWEASFLAFHAFHTLSFPWPAFRSDDAGFTTTSTSAMGRTREEVFVVIVVDEGLAILHQSRAHVHVRQIYTQGLNVRSGNNLKLIGAKDRRRSLDAGMKYSFTRCQRILFAMSR